VERRTPREGKEERARFFEILQASFPSLGKKGGSGSKRKDSREDPRLGGWGGEGCSLKQKAYALAAENVINRLSMK